MLQIIICLVATFCLLYIESYELHFYQTNCVNKASQINCNYYNDSRTIQVNYGFWGRKDNFTCIRNGRKPKNWNCTLEIKELMMDQCNGKERCNYTSTRDLFGGDPCPGDTKYSTIGWTCIKPEETTTETTTEPPAAIVKGPTVCYARTIRVQCDGKKKIKINKVFFGRTDATTCLPPYSHYFARYFNYTCDATNAAYNYTQQKCNGKTMCDLWNTIGYGYDVMYTSCTPAHLPYLKIDHQCV